MITIISIIRLSTFPITGSRFDLFIRKGERIAIVASSGSGKSTLAKLLTRLYDTTEGKITISGRDLSSFQLNQVRKEIAYISQTPYCISGSIYDNLVLGLDSQTETSRLNQVLHLLGLDNDLQGMPDGLQTYLGENGNLLSSGQKQRIAIGQALLRNSSIIIFDEATSNLDVHNESHINEVIQNLPDNITILTIAHRLTTIIQSDRIIFLDKGKITGQGNHQELYIQHPTYRSYIDKQKIKTNRD